MTNSLAWRDKWVARLVQTLSAYSEGSCDGATPQIISGEENYVILKVSLDEWKKLFSSVFTGADFCYPDESDNVRWILQRAVECPVSICDLIIACLLDEESGTLAAIIDGLIASAPFNDFLTEKVEGLTEGQIVSPLVAGSCDLAVLAGKMLTLAERLDVNNKDALEIIEVGTNDEERVAALIAGVPGLGVLPFDEVIDLLQKLLEDLGENYLAASTTARVEALARDLWCMAQTKEDCVVTYADLFVFFQDRVSSGLTLDSLVENIISWILLGDFPTDQLVFDAFFALQIAFVRVGKEFFGIDMPKIGALTRDAEPSNIYLEWDDCGEPPPDPECYNLKADDFFWTASPDSAYGTWTYGQGLGPTLFPPSTWRFNWVVIANASGGGNVTRIKLRFNEPCVNFIVYAPTGSYGPVSGLTEIDIDESDAPAMFPINKGTQYIAMTTTGNVVTSTFRVDQSCFYVT